MTVVIPICVFCVNLLPNNEEVLGLCCRAFPDGIPDEVVFGQHLHQTPLKNDQGIQFAEDPENPIPEGFLDVFENIGTPRPQMLRAGEISGGFPSKR